MNYRLCSLAMLLALVAGVMLGAWTAPGVAAFSPDSAPPIVTPVSPNGLPICPDADEPPPDPTDLLCMNVSPTEMELCWRDNSCIESEFQIERSTDGVIWKLVGTTARNVATFRDTGLTPGTTYSYRVRAFRIKTGQFSGYTNVSTCTTSGLGLLKPPDGSLICDPPPVFSWLPVSGAVTYTLQVGADPGFTRSLAINVALPGATTYTPTTDLVAGEYFWRVRAENACASTGWSGIWRFRIGRIVHPPDLLSPPDNSTFCDPAPVFAWLAVPGALSYEIEIDGLIYPVSGTSFNPGFGFPPGRHCWRVRAIGECGPSPWSAQWCFNVETTPDAPGITGPPDGTRVCVPRPTFSWTPSPGADTCCFQIDDDPAFGSPLIDTCGVGPDFTPAIDLSPGTYYWHVRCANECGPGPWSPGREIIVNETPGTPTPTAPLTGDTTCDLTPTLAWSAVPDATSYRVQLTGGDCNFEAPLVDSTVVTTSLTITIPLSVGTYCWRVQAIGECGPGPWSAPQSFAVSTPPGPPELSSPPDKSQDCDPTPTFTWSPVVGAFSYELQIDDASCDFLPPIVDVTVAVTSHTVSPALAPGTYCWRVRAIAECGPGEWSGTWNFTVRGVPPTPILVSPPNGTQTCDPSLTLCWMTVTGATSYELELDGVTYDDLAGPCFDTPNLGPGRHTWRVRAINECGQSEWSETRSFTVQPEVQVCEELLCNNSFETNECWIDPLACQPKYTTDRAHTGARSMQLGVPTSVPDTRCHSAIWQTITVPADATQVTLAFYYWPVSADTVANDWQEVQVRDANNKIVLETLMKVAENNGPNDPWRFRSFDLTRYAGQKITVYFNVYNNGASYKRTSMYVDDITLQACREECPSGEGTVTGQVMLQARNGAYGGVVVSADGLPCAVTTPDGRFKCTLPAGVHTLTATDCKYLEAKLPGVRVDDGAWVTVRDSMLNGGDANNDTQINLFDIVVAGAAFGECLGGDPCPGPDINGDGCTNIFDLVVVGGNYGVSGPTGWLRPTTLAAQSVRPARLELVAEGDRWLVRLRDAAGVYGVQLRLRYDPAELSALDAGDKAAGRLEAKLSRLETTPHYVFENAVLPASGEVRIAYTLLNPALPLSGDVVLAEIPAAATGNLSFVEALLADREGQALPVTWEPNIKKKGR